MQDRYVGDIGDFGKYGLLRALTEAGHTPALHLGMVWYLYPDECHNDDGKFTGYLCENPRNHSRFRTCDPPLYDTLHNLVCDGQRNVAAVRHRCILPSTTTYYEHPLSYPPRMPLPERQEVREQWLKAALLATTTSDLIFVDPDNGISRTASPWRKKGPKYMFIDDCRRFYERGQSLVIYHHLGRRGSAEQQINCLAELLKQELGLTRLPWALRYRRGSARAYFIAAQENHEAYLESRLKPFVESPWNAHFQRVEPSCPINDLLQAESAAETSQLCW